MIYELITQNVRPGTQGEVEKRYAEIYEKRKQFSELGAFWHTEIGPLNQVVHIWPYQDLAERLRVRSEAMKAKVWSPDIAQFLVNSSAQILMTLPFSPPLKPVRNGPYFEMRTYTFVEGELPMLVESWERVLEERLKFGPLCGVWYSELGTLNQFIQIWPFKTLNEREDTREKARIAGCWPPSAAALKAGSRGAELAAQENKILKAAAFSPIQ